MPKPDPKHLNGEALNPTWTPNDQPAIKGLCKEVVLGNPQKDRFCRVQVYQYTLKP